jgi:hypothetical protein
MSIALSTHHHAPALTAIAFHLSAALESYQQHVDELVDPWAQRDGYKRVSDEFDTVRMLKGALPDLSVAMVEVLLAHVELMSALWTSTPRPDKRSGSVVDTLRGKHRRAVDAMRDRCVRYFSRRH